LIQSNFGLLSRSFSDPTDSSFHQKNEADGLHKSTLPLQKGLFFFEEASRTELLPFEGRKEKHEE